MEMERQVLYMSVCDSPGRRAELILQAGTLRCPQDTEHQEFGRGWSAPVGNHFQSNSPSLSPGVLQTLKDLTPHAQGPERSSRVADFSHFYTRGNQGPNRVSGLPEAWNSQRPTPVVGWSYKSTPAVDLSLSVLLIPRVTA